MGAGTAGKKRRGKVGKIARECKVDTGEEDAEGKAGKRSKKGLGEKDCTVGI